jgi:F-type H+-transporting ATPase subunit gamma
MAGLKEIKRRLTSVKNTKKITYAMKLVAAAKLRRVQEEVTGFRKYRDSLYILHDELQIVRNDKQVNGSTNSLIKRSTPKTTQEGSELLYEERDEIKSIQVLIFGGFRGLAGGYNSNINKVIDSAIKDLTARYPNATISAIVIGKKACEYVQKRGIAIAKSYDRLPEAISKWPLQEISTEVVADFWVGNIDKAFIIFTEFKSALSQSVVVNQLLPFSILNHSDYNDRNGKDLDQSLHSKVQTRNIIYEPSLSELLSQVIQRIVKAELVYAALNAQASEHGSRMTAMDAATRNASDLVNSLRLTYNKLRQSGITAELLDIIGGAEAIS